MRPKRLVWQLVPSFLLVTLISLLGVTWYAAESWREFYLKQTASDLELDSEGINVKIFELKPINPYPKGKEDARNRFYHSGE